jgi:hypothetical protein
MSAPSHFFALSTSCWASGLPSPSAWRPRLRAPETLHELLIDEINHRVKNTLATVQSLASQTFR